MCLAIPGIVEAIENSTARINYNGLSKSADTTLCPQAKIGDYVLVHAGFIIQILNPEEGQELAELHREIFTNGS